MGFKLFLLGFSLIFIGAILMVISALRADGRVDAGIIIFIGPFPIVVGTGTSPVVATLLAAVLTVLCLILFLLWKKTR